MRIAQESLVDELLKNLPEGFTPAEVETPNSDFTQPANKKWIRIQPFYTSKSNVVAGGGYTRTFGFLVISIFHPRRTGSFAILDDSVHIQNTYQNNEFENARCQEVFPLGEADVSDNWYRLQLQVNFYYEGAKNAN